MHYYRYRSDSELSLKELIYNEIYFASPEESNDPFDSKSFYEFPHDRIRWGRLLDQALHIPDEKFKEHLIIDLVAHICKQPVLSLEELLGSSFLNLAPLNKLIPEQSLVEMENAVRSLVSGYIPATRFFISLSRSSNEQLMWSHYANSHKGYCLIFKSIEGQLNLSTRSKRKSISRKTPKGIAQQMSYSLPESFTFTDIDYRRNVEPLNAFKCMSAFIYGEEGKSESELSAIRIEQESHFQQKEQSWAYEQEARLILPPPPAFLFGEHITYSSHERLFHYEPTQLVGIIFGAKMPQKQRERIREILEEKNRVNDESRNTPYVKFDFVIHEAVMSANQRTITVKPLEIIGGVSCKPVDESFEKRYEKWNNGWGLQFSGNSARSIQCK